MGGARTGVPAQSAAHTQGGESRAGDRQHTHSLQQVTRGAVNQSQRSTIPNARTLLFFNKLLLLGPEHQPQMTSGQGPLQLCLCL